MTLYLDELRTWYEENQSDIVAGLIELDRQYQPVEDNKAFQVLFTIQALAEEGHGLRFTDGEESGSLWGVKNSSIFWSLPDSNRAKGSLSLVMCKVFGWKCIKHE